MSLTIGSTSPTLEEIPERTASRISESAQENQPFSRVLDSKIAKAGIGKDRPKSTSREYTVKPGDTLWKLGIKKFQVDPYQLARENGIANPHRIYPGQKLVINQTANPGPQEVVASWYGEDYHRKPTASGEIFDMFKNTLAHKTLPLGTQVQLTNPHNGKTVTGRINDRGPFIPGRDVDLSYGLAKQLGMVSKGVGRLLMEII